MLKRQEAPAQIGRMLEGRICGLRIPKVFFSNRFRVARMGVSVLSVVLRGTRGVGGRKIVKLQYQILDIPHFSRRQNDGAPINKGCD